MENRNIGPDSSRVVKPLPVPKSDEAKTKSSESLSKKATSSVQESTSATPSPTKAEPTFQRTWSKKELPAVPTKIEAKVKLQEITNADRAKDAALRLRDAALLEKADTLAKRMEVGMSKLKELASELEKAEQGGDGTKSEEWFGIQKARIEKAEAEAAGDSPEEIAWLDEKITNAEKKVNTLKNIILEVINTEKSYLRGLEVGQQELNSLLLLHPENEDLTILHYKLTYNIAATAKVIEQFEKGDKSVDEIVEVVLSDTFKEYARAMAECILEYENISTMYKELRPPDSKITLLEFSASIILPVQRMPRYVMLFTDLMKNVDPSRSKVAEAKEKLEKYARTNNIAQGRSDINKMDNLLSKLNDQNRIRIDNTSAYVIAPRSAPSSKEERSESNEVIKKIFTDIERIIDTKEFDTTEEAKDQMKILGENLWAKETIQNSPELLKKYDVLTTVATYKNKDITEMNTLLSQLDNNNRIKSEFINGKFTYSIVPRADEEKGESYLTLNKILTDIKDILQNKDVDVTDASKKFLEMLEKNEWAFNTIKSEPKLLEKYYDLVTASFNFKNIETLNNVLNDLKQDLEKLGMGVGNNREFVIKERNKISPLEAEHAFKKAISNIREGIKLNNLTDDQEAVLYKTYINLISIYQSQHPEIITEEEKVLM